MMRSVLLYMYILVIIKCTCINFRSIILVVTRTICDIAMFTVFILILFMFVAMITECE